MVERYQDGVRTVGVPSREAAAIDEGLRSYMLGVYNYMASGVLLTGIIALFTASSPAMMSAIFTTPLYYAVLFGPLAFILVLSFGIHRLSTTTAQALYWAFTVVMGLSLSSIFHIYKLGSVATIFFVTTAMFGSLSLYGYTTKKSLSGWGTFLFMGLIGLIVASIANFFLQSPALYYGLSLIGVLIFAGLTAYDTQMIKHTYFMTRDGEARAKSSVLGALRLYLDFINMFLYLLRLFGSRD